VAAVELTGLVGCKIPAGLVNSLALKLRSGERQITFIQQSQKALNFRASFAGQLLSLGSCLEGLLQRRIACFAREVVFAIGFADHKTT